MYEQYWKLQELPFEPTPDPRFLYRSKQHEEGLMRLLYIVKTRKGAGMMTGVFGCGKTLLAQALFDSLEKGAYVFAHLTNPRLSELDLLRVVMSELGDSDPPGKKSTGLIRLKALLENNYRDGKQTILIIDDAHTIEAPGIFEELRLLLNLQLKQQFLLTLFLLGQPELTEKVNSLKPFAQRIAMRFHLGPLNLEETGEYIAHRLGVAKAPGDIFSHGAVQVIYEVSGGIPRRINQISDMSLYSGCVKQGKQIDPEIVRDAILSIEGET